MAQLLPLLNAYLTAEHVSPLARALEETENKVSKALGSMSVTILSGLLEPGRHGLIIEQVENFSLELTAQDFQEPGSRFLPEGAFLWDQLWGENDVALLHAVAAFSGVKPSTTAALKPLAGALALTILKRFTLMVLLLQAEQSAIMAKLPGQVATMLGLVKTPAREESNSRWFYALLLLFILGTFLAYCLKYG